MNITYVFNLALGSADDTQTSLNFRMFSLPRLRPSRTWGSFARRRASLFSANGNFCTCNCRPDGVSAIPSPGSMSANTGKELHVPRRQRRPLEWYHILKGGRGVFGGLIAENATQALCRDIFVDALLRLEAAGYRPVAHLHDEFVCEVPDGFGSIEEFRAIITQAPSWRRISRSRLRRASPIGSLRSKSQKPITRRRALSQSAMWTNETLDLVWETRDGRMIPVFQMETPHILNCVARIKREWPWRAEYLRRLEMELALRLR